MFPVPIFDKAPRLHVNCLSASGQTSIFLGLGHNLCPPADKTSQFEEKSRRKNGTSKYLTDTCSDELVLVVRDAWPSFPGYHAEMCCAIAISANAKTIVLVCKAFR
jgi:hypothetical protein